MARIVAPNWTCEDDSHNSTISSTLAKLASKGLTVQSCCTEGWGLSQKDGVLRLRVWMIDVVEGTLTDEVEILDAPVLGTVVVHEIEAVKGTGCRFGYTEGTLDVQQLKERLGVR